MRELIVHDALKIATRSYRETMGTPVTRIIMGRKVREVYNEERRYLRRLRVEYARRRKARARRKR